MLLLQTFDSLDDIANTSIQKLQSLGIPKNIAEELLNKLNNKEE